MTLNPRDYDLDELRKMARERGQDPRGPPGGDSEESQPQPQGPPGGDGEEPRSPLGADSDERRGPPGTDSSDDAARPEMGGWETDTNKTANRPARDQFQSGLYRELLPLEAGAGDLEKPYLTDLPESYAAEYVIFEWLEFLLTNFGYQGTNEALQYYKSVGWITEDVETTLNDYLLGLHSPGKTDTTETSMDDHKLSLVYIARIVSMN